MVPTTLRPRTAPSTYNVGGQDGEPHQTITTALAISAEGACALRRVRPGPGNDNRPDQGQPMPTVQATAGPATRGPGPRPSRLEYRDPSATARRVRISQRIAAVVIAQRLRTGQSVLADRVRRRPGRRAVTDGLPTSRGISNSRSGRRWSIPTASRDLWRAPSYGGDLVALGDGPRRRARYTARSRYRHGATRVTTTAELGAWFPACTGYEAVYAIRDAWPCSVPRCAEGPIRYACVAADRSDGIEHRYAWLEVLIPVRAGGRSTSRSAMRGVFAARL